MKYTTFLLLLLIASLNGYTQNTNQLILPNSTGWNILNENQEIAFQVQTDSSNHPFYSLEGAEELEIKFDSLGNFKWTPSFDLVNRVERTKDFTVIFQARWAEDQRVRQAVTFTVHHVNRPPVVEELPVFYVKQSALNNYQISSDYVYDPDGDPLVYKPVQTQMPEGAILSSQGQITWTPSRGQFYNLRANPITIEFIVQDQPDKAETKGKLRIAQTQQDLPPEILIVPSDSAFTIKEDETLNLKLYISDPNGDDNVLSADFVPSDTRIPSSTLKENTLLQYEFTWTPGYYFVEEVQKYHDVDVTFFALDKSNNRVQRKIKIRINDAENLEEKDAHQYQKYRNNLISAMNLIRLLDENNKKLNNDYRKARRGKKHRSILNASLGATTGISPLALEADQAKIVSGVGGTTVLTLGTLEATEVIGRSKDAILEKIKLGIEIRNKIQSNGDEFARKYALKSARRSPDFEKDIDKFRVAMNDQKLILLEIDAYSKDTDKISNKDLKKFFVDFSEE